MTAASSGLARRCLGAAFVALAVLAAASPAAACSSNQPTFEEAVTGAQAIAVVTILDGAAPGVPNLAGREVYRVDRVLKGSLPEVVTLEPADTSLCLDRISLYASNGQRAIVAFFVAYYDTRIHPAWVFSNANGPQGSAGLPFAASTLADVEGAIVAAVGSVEESPTLEGEPPPAHGWLPAVFVAAGVALAAAGARLLIQRNARR